MSDNVTYYTPVVFNKGTFNQIEQAAETQGEEVEFQTTELVSVFIPLTEGVFRNTIAVR